MRKLIIFLTFFFAAFSLYSSEPLPVNAVYQLSTKVIDPNTFAVTWKIKPGYKLYRNSLHFNAATNSNFTLGDIRFPKATRIIDQQGKPCRVYRDEVTVILAILGESPGSGEIDVGYQGCADDGFCYPPQSKKLKLTINPNLALNDIAISETPVDIPITTVISGEGSQIKQLFASKNWLLIFFSFLGFGIFLTFTPCVFPMIPIISSIIIGQGKKISTHKAFSLSLTYVLSMATTYAIIGAIVAKLGANIQIAMQSPWSIGLLSIVFCLLALSMFGFYDLKLPNSWQTKLRELSHKRATGQYIGTAIMGCLATLILSPCVTAPLIGALGYIAASGDVMRGTIALFFLGLGMGIPLLIIGTWEGKFLPKAGIWMNVIKDFFGVVLLATAIYILERILPSVIIMVMWASLLIFCGIYVGAFIKPRTNLDKFRKGLGIILLAYGLLVLLGASRGNINPLQPLASEPNQSQSKGVESKKLTSLKAVQEALTTAKGTPVILDFYADWCASCQHIEATTMKNPEVISALHNFVFIKVDVTQNNTDSKDLLDYFKVIAPPTFLFYNQNGEELNDLRLGGDITASMLLTNMQQAK